MKKILPLLLLSSLAGSCKKENIGDPSPSIINERTTTFLQPQCSQISTALLQDTVELDFPAIIPGIQAISKDTSERIINGQLTTSIFTSYRVGPDSISIIINAFIKPDGTTQYLQDVFTTTLPYKQNISLQSQQLTAILQKMRDDGGIKGKILYGLKYNPTIVSSHERVQGDCLLEISLQ